MKIYFLFAFWFVSLSIPLSYMMGSHSLSLNPSKQENLKSLINPKSNEVWSKLHFLGSDCGCSEKIFKSLMERSPEINIDEQVFVIGTNDLWVTHLKKKGYSTQTVSMDEFAKKYSINAVPQLTIFDEKKNIRYSGGYTSSRNPASSVEDQKITAEIKAKNKTIERPIFGCLSGSLNRKSTDPLSLKY